MRLINFNSIVYWFNRRGCEKCEDDSETVRIR